MSKNIFDLDSYDNYNNNNKPIIITEEKKLFNAVSRGNFEFVNETLQKQKETINIFKYFNGYNVGHIAAKKG